MLTVDFDRLGLRPGDRVLDMGCGAGRHAFEMYRRGADVVAFDQDADELRGVRDLFAAMPQAGEVPDGRRGRRQGGRRARRCRSPTASSTGSSPPRSSSTSPPTSQAIDGAGPRAPPGRHASPLTVPRWLPEVVCWKLSDDYHDTPGGHIRIYTDAELVDQGRPNAGPGLRRPPLRPRACTRRTGGSSARSASTNDDHPLAKAYHRLLVWDIMKQPRTHPAGRAGAQPGARQEPGGLPPQAADASPPERDRAS